VLQGKHKPTYDPAGTSPPSSFPKGSADLWVVDAGDYVTVTEALDVHLSGNKARDKVYRRHSGFIGGLKEVPIGRVRERMPEEVSASDE
jgi:large subunit ribosomal protein L13